MGLNLGDIFATVRLNTAPWNAGLFQVRGSVRSIDKLMDDTSKRGAAKLMKFGDSFAIFGALVAGVGTKMAMDFDLALREVNSLIRGSEERFQDLKKEILDLTKTTKYSAEEMANGFYYVVSAMPDASDTDRLNVLSMAEKGARAGLADLTSTADALTTALNAWGSTDAEHYMDVLLKTVERGKLKLPDLTSNLSKVAASAANLGIPIETVGAAISTMTRNGITAERTTMSLNRAMLGLLKPSEDAAKWFNDLGYSSGQAMIKAIGFEGVMAKMHESFGDNTEAMAQMFPNIRELLTYLNLAGLNFSEFIADMGEFGDTAGQVNEMLKQIESSPVEQLKVAWNEAKVELIEIGSKIMPAVSSGLKFLAGNLGIVAEAAMGFAVAWAAVKAVMIGQSMISGITAASSALKIFAGDVLTNLTMGFSATTASAGGLAVSLGSIGTIVLPLIIGVGLAIKKLYEYNNAADAAAEAQVKSREETAKSGIATLKHVEELEQLRAAQANCNEGSAEYASYAQQITEKQNEIAGLFPSLVAGWDSERNAILKDTEEMRRNLIARISMGGANVTPGAPIEIQELEAASQAMLVSQQNANILTSEIDSLANYIQELSGVSRDAKDYYGEVFDAFAEGAERGQENIKELIYEMARLGATDDELELIDKLMNPIIHDINEWGGSLDELNQKYLQGKSAWTQALESTKRRTVELAQETGELPQYIITAITNSDPMIREGGVQLLSTFMQAIKGGLDPTTANTIAQNLFNTGTFVATGNQAIDAALEAIRVKLQQARLHEQISSSLGKVDLGSALSWGGTETVVSAKIEYTSEGIDDAVAEAEQKVSDSKPFLTVGADVATAKKQISDFSSQKRYINFTGRITGWEVNPTFATPREAGVWAGEQIAEGIGSVGASVNFRGGAAGVESTAGVIDNLKNAWADLNATALVWWSQSVDNQKWGQIEQAIWNLAGGNEAIAQSQLEAWRNMRNTYDTAQAKVDEYNKRLDESETKVNKWRHEQELLQRKLQDVNEELEKQNNRLTELSNMKLKGQTAAEDKIFAKQMEITKLELERLKIEQKISAGKATDADFARLADIELAKEKLDLEKQIAETQMDADYSEQQRAIEKMLQDENEYYNVQEMTFAQIKSEITNTKSIIQTKNTELEKTQNIIDGIEKKITAELDVQWALKVEIENTEKVIQEYSATIDAMANNFMDHYNDMIKAQQELNKEMAKSGGSTGGTPQYASGASYVWQTGPAIVHKGETILNPQQTQMRQMDLMRNKDMMITIPIYLDGKLIARETSKITGRKIEAFVQSGGRY